MVAGATAAGAGRVRVIGIDPGVNTGVAIFTDGRLVGMCTITPFYVAAVLDEIRPWLVVVEDSRLQSHIWTGPKAHGAAALKVARNVGMVDWMCACIQDACETREIVFHAVSPRAKGGKVAAAGFRALTGWRKRCSQHARDAAMLAWPYRRARLQ